MAVFTVMAVLLMRSLPGAIAIAAARRALTFEVARARTAVVFAAFSTAFRRPARNAIAIGIPRSTATAASATTTATSAAFAIALARHRSCLVRAARRRGDIAARYANIAARHTAGHATRRRDICRCSRRILDTRWTRFSSTVTLIPPATRLALTAALAAALTAGFTATVASTLAIPVTRSARPLATTSLTVARAPVGAPLLAATAFAAMTIPRRVAMRLATGVALAIAVS